MRIGILEDNPGILEMFQTVLELENHTVGSHMTGDALLAQLFANFDPSDADPRRSLSYDILTIDLHVPGHLSGRGVIERISQQLPLEMFPVVVISAASDTELQSLSAAFPSVKIMRKPVHLNHLLRTLTDRFEATRGLTQDVFARQLSEKAGEN